MDNLIKPIDLAKLLGVTTQTLTRWRKEGLGPEWIKLNGSVRYRREDVESYLDQCTPDKREP